MPSSNVMRMSERPYSEMERMTFMCGIPFISISSGTVMRRSTSSAAWPGHWVMISTIGGDRSGYASTGSRRKDQIPMPTRSTADRPTRNR